MKLVKLKFRLSLWALGALLAGVGMGSVPAAAGGPVTACGPAPVITSVTPGDTAVSLTWNPPCSNGSAITSYVVTAHDGCTIQGAVTVTGSPPATTVNFTGLNNGSPMSFTVAAVTGLGTSPDSAPAGPVTPAGATSPTVVSACSARQYSLAGSNGSTWADMDLTNLSLTFTPGADSFAEIGGNVDLWTANRGYNQDVGIAVTSSDAVYPTVAGQPEAWKESGGFGGTFSPNAAYVGTVIPVLASATYTVTLRWKANKRDSGTIFAGAGAALPGYSPTRLTVQLIPQGSTVVLSKTSTAQFKLTSSDGNAWSWMDSADSMVVQFTAPGTGGWYAMLSASADLWTSRAGLNQDLGIFFAGGVYEPPSFVPAAWKESGGFAGTFSPNAAYVQTELPVVGGITYVAELRWKKNQLDGVHPIYAGAGPVAGKFSPTSLNVTLVPALQMADLRTQYTQQHSDGTSWLPMDASNLTLASGGTDVLVSVNVDLWTQTAGFNQDIGIMASGGAYGQGTLVAWKESGGYSGTYSPNAAFVSTVLHIFGAGVTVTVVWKANRAGPSQIDAGAGPANGTISPTTLIAEVLD